ncbi:hypothetical protein PVAP13_2NG159803 [Panicum virgatum]|uniref:Uncharacterized protein n=1 Tax=Panicum virgatum TaxID=38727 RepID=A0A8T0VIZ6_PANVG|nr:hypothetical protein PVAP13_2NG159803 [Panicum virgatum]
MHGRKGPAGAAVHRMLSAAATWRRILLAFTSGSMFCMLNGKGEAHDPRAAGGGVGVGRCGASGEAAAAERTSRGETVVPGGWCRARRRVESTQLCATMGAPAGGGGAACWSPDGDLRRRRAAVWRGG